MGTLRARRGWIRAIRLVTGAALAVAGLAVSVGAAGAAATLSAPSGGQAGKEILLAGAGWPALESAFAYLVQGTTKNFVCTLATDAGGNLGPQTCALPAGLPQGAYTLQVTDASATTASQPFTLRPAAHISPSATGAPTGSVAAGQTVYLSGAGFSAGSTISQVKVGATAVTTNPAAPAVSAQGSFSGVAFTVPATLAAGPTLLAVTDSAGKSASFALTTFAATVTAPASGVSGRNLILTGTGWPAGDSVFAYLQQGATLTFVCTAGTDGSGNLGPQACPLPTGLPQGSYLLHLTDDRLVVDRAFSLDPGALIAATPSGSAIGAAAKGQTVYLSGTGFSAGSTITSAKVGSTAVALAPTAPAVSSQGSFGGASFVVPKGATAGIQTVSITDSASKVATFKLEVLAATVTVAASGASGNHLKIAGAGWPSNESVFAYLVQGTTQTFVCTLGTDASGDLGPQDCAVPTGLPSGPYSLLFSDTRASVTRPFTLDPAAHVSTLASATPIGAVAAGQSVGIAGTGFTAGSTIAAAKIGSTAMPITPAGPAVSSQGSFSGATITIPSAQPAGVSTVTVTDSSGHPATFALSVYDATDTAPPSGSAGRSLALSGAGWPSNDTVFAYLQQGSSLTFLCTVATDDSGALGPQTCALPAGLPQGAYTLLTADQLGVTVGKAFTLNPSATLLNASNQQISTAARGSTVELTGIGFTASSTIASVKVGPTSVTTTPSPPLVNAQGGFGATSFVVPAVPAGAYTVTVTDSSGKKATAPLTVT